MCMTLVSSRTLPSCFWTRMGICAVCWKAVVDVAFSHKSVSSKLRVQHATCLQVLSGALNRSDKSTGHTMQQYMGKLTLASLTSTLLKLMKQGFTLLSYCDLTGTHSLMSN